MGSFSNRRKGHGNMHGRQLLLAVFVACSAQRALAQDDIDSLLQQANSALHGAPTTPDSKKAEAGESGAPATPSGPAKGRGKRAKRPVSKSPAPDDFDSTSDGSNPAPSAPAPVTNEPVQPLTQKSLDQVLALDVQAREREKYTGVRWFMTRVGIGFDRIGTSYKFTKDDDTFTVAQRTSLMGASAEVGTITRIDRLSANSFAARGALLAGLGYYQGNVPVAREGIDNYEQNYQYQLIPFDLAIGLGFDYGSDYGFLLSYGVGTELMHQSGTGQTDTFSDMFIGDVLSATFTWHYDRELEVFLRAQKRGTGWSGSANIAGQVFAMGVGMPFRG